jgi:hypothetical protein
MSTLKTEKVLRHHPQGIMGIDEDMIISDFADYRAFHKG